MNDLFCLTKVEDPEILYETVATLLNKGARDVDSQPTTRAAVCMHVCMYVFYIFMSISSLLYRYFSWGPLS